MVHKLLTLAALLAVAATCVSVNPVAAQTKMDKKPTKMGKMSKMGKKPTKMGKMGKMDKKPTKMGKMGKKS